jgi:N-acetylneuraminic acid mutarotase
MRWQLVHPTGAGRKAPTPRIDATTWYCDGALWLFSGIGEAADAPFTDLWRFDTTPRTWSQPAETENYKSVIAPTGRLSAASWVRELRLVMYGGAIGSKLLDCLWNFDVQTCKWSRGDVLQIGPGARSGSAAWHDGNSRAWLFGGIGQDRDGAARILADLWSYSDTTGSWQLEDDRAQKRRLPPPLARSSTCVTREHCWLFDGLPPFAHGDASTAFWAFDKYSGIATDYSAEADAEHVRPDARVGAAICSDEANRIYLFGGLSTNHRRSHLNDLWIFDAASRKWTLFDPGGFKDQWPSPRSNACVWSDQRGHMWLFGGYGLTSRGDATTLGDLWVLTIE